ncbi:DUF92 domain-containing protein [Alkalihalobacillus hwajinpoensis]|uniref:DUF92 domain-containing protein n=1 Tax=Guptibacillus hwajinpoensis TaxID=208199 RepID=UPI0018835A0A|nr:DUF92 domain-containing protein [Pseudalkalibacillus hwajinpoensis]MBF0709280.1 DUF92 domain-containing protein [Pseudalkalibacillus hwajinpoensis]
MIIYAFLSAITGILGYKVHALSRNGAIAATGVGCAIALGFGWKGLLLLGIFFLTSTIWSKYKAQLKDGVEQIVEKGASRDQYQVLANGGVAAFAGIMMLLFPGDVWLFIFLSAIATSNSDTWASELGVLSKRRPLHIITMKFVPAGTSGAISMPGILASLLGAGLIGGVGSLVFDLSFLGLVIVTVAGFVGCLSDTLIGATLQEELKCQKCGSKTERHIHCGNRTVKISGIKGFNNDVVNFASSMIGALVGGAWWL